MFCVAQDIKQFESASIHMWLQDKSAIVESRKHDLAREMERLSQLESAVKAADQQLQQVKAETDAMRAKVEQHKNDVQR